MEAQTDDSLVAAGAPEGAALAPEQVLLLERLTWACGHAAATSRRANLRSVLNAFFRYKSIIGDSLRACSAAGRGTEVDLACNILNQMTGLGRPMSYRIGR